MLNSFPQQGATDSETLLKTYRAVLGDIGSQAIVEAAQKFVTGDVKGQSLTFAPSVAEFVQEARRIDALIPYRDRKLLSSKPKPEIRIDRAEEARMRLRLPMLREAMRRGQIDRVQRANTEGLAALVTLAKEWEIPVPEEVRTQLAAA